MVIKLGTTSIAGLCVLVGLFFVYRSLTVGDLGVLTDATIGVAAFVLALVVLKIGELWTQG